jgi:hypothetical protein
MSEPQRGSRHQTSSQCGGLVAISDHSRSGSSVRGSERLLSRLRGGRARPASESLRTCLGLGLGLGLGFGLGLGLGLGLGFGLGFG